MIDEELFYEQLNKQLLDEGFFANLISGAVKLLGFTSLTGLSGLGAILLAKTAISKRDKVRKWTKKSFKKNKDFDFDDSDGKFTTKKTLSSYDEMSKKLKDVFKAIEMNDWNEAERMFKASPYADNVEAIKAIALKVTDTIGEPPLFVYPSGNKTYFVLKQIITMKYAKAITQSVLAALKQNKSYYSDINSQDLKLGLAEE